MNQVLEELSRIGIVPVIKIDRASDAAPLAGALIRGGLPCAEVTFRTSAAKEAISIIAREYPDMLVGAGTVLTTKQVDDAVEAGAKFIVSPGFNPDVVKYCVLKGIPIAPGINNPSGVEQALSMGLDVVKFFPAEQSGGLKMIKAMSAPYAGVRFMPTGGINVSNVCEYLADSKILCCGGSWMVKPEMILAGDFEGIEALVRRAVDTMLGFRPVHIGINSQNREAAEATVRCLGEIFSFAADRRSASAFAGSCIEVMDGMGRGSMGHIAIGTNSVDRAVYHLSRRGVRFDLSTASYGADGKMKFIYLADEIGGFAFHLVQNA